MTPREILAAAIAERTQAEEVARQAQESLAGADQLVADLKATVEAFAGVGERIASERAGAVKAAVAAGVRPVFDPSPELADAMTRKAEAENQADAARQARAELEREVDQANVALGMARNRVAAAVNGVIRAEAEAMAKEVQAIEAQAAAIRLKMFGAEYVPAVARTKPGEAETAVYKTDRTQGGVPNTPDWKVADAYRVKWRDLANNLASDATATLEGGNHG